MAASRRLKLLLPLLTLAILGPLFLSTDEPGGHPERTGLDGDSSELMNYVKDATSFAFSDNSTRQAKQSHQLSDQSSQLWTKENLEENHRVRSRVLSELIDETHKPEMGSQIRARVNKQSISMDPPDARVRNIKDQLLRARVYLSLGSIRANPQYVRDLRLRIREVQRALGDATKDSDLPKNARDKAKALEQTLAKGKNIQDDSAIVVKKLRAMLHMSEEQLRAHRKQMIFLTQLAAKTLPRGLHCLPLRLSSEFFLLHPSQQHFPNQEKLEDPNLYHYVLFSDNILATAVVVNSTVTNSKDPSQLVFHIVTNGLYYLPMKMWFLAIPPGNATIQVQNIEELTWLADSPAMKQLAFHPVVDYYFGAHQADSDANLKYRNPKYSSRLNHLRFYLPDIYPKLNKVVFLDYDIVVQKDLSGLWSIDLKGKVNGAVETCGEGFHRVDQLLNFSNSLIANSFDPHSCSWAFGLNIFDLAEWRWQNITKIYHSWLEHNHDRHLWKVGTLPPGQIVFWNHTFLLDQSWHLLGLGHNPHVASKDIQRAAVIHYSGDSKPWLEIGLPNYRGYWSKYLNYDHVFLRECNINP